MNSAPVLLFILAFGTRRAAVCSGINHGASLSAIPNTNKATKYVCHVGDSLNVF